MEKQQGDERDEEDYIALPGNQEDDEIVPLYTKAGFFSLFIFSWMDPLISLGHKKTLNLEDIPELDISDSVRHVFPVFNAKTSSISSRMLLAKALISTVWRELVASGVYLLVSAVAAYVSPYYISTFVKRMNQGLNLNTDGFALVSIFFTAKFVECFSAQHGSFKGHQAGNRIRAALIAKIYNKGLALSCKSRQAYTNGEITNLMSGDVERVASIGAYVHSPWLIVVQLVLAFLILYRDLGLASVAALVAVISVMLLGNGPLGKLQNKFEGELMKCKDETMKATSQVLGNMRVLKLHGWELKFLSKIMDLRSVEMRWLRKYLYSSVVTIFVSWGALTFLNLATFGAYMLLVVGGGPIESGKIITALTTFNILQGPTRFFPHVVSMFVQAKVSLDRIVSFISLDDDLQLQSSDVESSNSDDVAVEVINGSFSWGDTASSSSAELNELRDIDLRVPRGTRAAICGTVGSGKSSLLCCILGEMPKTSGVVSVSGRTAYVAQSPWIQSGKIEENILFGKGMDRERYNRVLEACSLNKDLETLSFGDQTVIGERGINLSGGQKQRIQIARALYQDADIYLFDDPFSAVDAHTGAHLFSECIMGFLESKTVIYVTHQVEFLPSADLILVMKDGKIKQSGKYNDILKSGSDFMGLVDAHREALSVLDVETDGKEEVGISRNAAKKQESRVDNSGDTKGSGEQIVQEEERQKGTVGLRVYWEFITTAAYGGLLALGVLVAQILFQLFQIGSNYWMAWETPVSSKDVGPHVGNSVLILVYAALSIAATLCILARGLILVSLSCRAGDALFSNMYRRIFRAPMSFFDSTPSARILSRACQDQGQVDMGTARQIDSFVFYGIQLLGGIVVMSQVAWQVLTISILAIAVCIWLQQYYMGASMELSRLRGVGQAPVIQHLSETLSGSITIRSFGQEHRFQDISMTRIDEYSRTWFHITAASEWLIIRLQTVALVTFAFSLIFLIWAPKGTIDPSVAGLAVIYGLNLDTLLAYVIMFACSMENNMISVERILQFTNIPMEPPCVVESNRPDSRWPVQGEVKIQDLQVRYAPHMPLVLHGLTCTFFGGKRTGIVGRTGCGKSTLIQTLFRIVEPTFGQILIDGIDISSIGLHDLRSRLSIIPQDPTMFEGSVRTNLDPLEEHTDEEIWQALDKCQLGDEVRKKADKLDSGVSENGENWSVGQRQLVCLGRMLLKKSKILVLDEATASVDTATDNLVQQILKLNFAGSTVLTIAHRISSVLDSDMVLLLDNGLVKEYDSTANLLEDKSSSFAKLVAEYNT